MVYLIVCPENNTCKIGYSSDPNKRIVNLQTSNPYSLEIAGMIEGDLSMEKELHNKFSKYRLKGEWFNLNTEIEDYFNAIHSGMYFLTNVESCSSLFELKSNIDLRLIIKMCMLAEFNTGKVYFPAEVRRQVCRELGIVNQQLSNSLKSLKDKTLITGSRGLFYINPKIFWKGNMETRNATIKSGMKITFEIE